MSKRKSQKRTSNRVSRGAEKTYNKIYNILIIPASKLDIHFRLGKTKRTIYYSNRKSNWLLWKWRVAGKLFYQQAHNECNFSRRIGVDWTPKLRECPDWTGINCFFQILLFGLIFFCLGECKYRSWMSVSKTWKNGKFDFPWNSYGTDRVRIGIDQSKKPRIDRTNIHEEPWKFSKTGVEWMPIVAKTTVAWHIKKKIIRKS